MTYIPGTGPQPLFPAAHLVLCPSVCPVSSLETRLTLHPAHPGCDRNTYSLAMMRKMCGASNMAVELLPEQSGSQSLSLSLLINVLLASPGLEQAHQPPISRLLVHI